MHIVTSDHRVMGSRQNGREAPHAGQRRRLGERAQSCEGGVGASWKGCFVGGEDLVRAVTRGPDGERLHGNFPDGTLLPERR